MKELKNTPIFKSGAESLVVVLGIVWLSSTLIGAHIDEIKIQASDMLRMYPGLLAVVFFLYQRNVIQSGRNMCFIDAYCRLYWY